MKTEIFKDIKGYENIYQVSNLGNVKTLSYNKTGKERIMKPTKEKNGYLKINLHKNNIRKAFLVHRLVADAFLSNPNNFKEINHINERKTDNRLENLEWCDRKYNINYGNRIKKSLETKNKKGSINAEKPIIQLTKNMIEIGRYKSLSEASRQTGISNPNIWSCCNGKRKSAGGYIWRYV